MWFTFVLTCKRNQHCQASNKTVADIELSSYCVGDLLRRWHAWTSLWRIGSHQTKMMSYTICIRTYVWIWSRDIDNDVSVASDVSTSGSDSWLSRNDVIIKCDVTIWNSTKINPKWQSQSNQKFNIYTELPITETKDLDNLRLHCILS